MNRVSEMADKLEDGWDSDGVHDLRVALRRCRTMADALSEVNYLPNRQKLNKTTRLLYQALGELRDSQVAKQWGKKLGAAKDPVRRSLLKVFDETEERQQK